MKSSESAYVFLRCGQTIACLRLRGTIPDERERFMIFVIVGNSEPTISFNSLVRIMSSSHVEFLAAIITLSISSSVKSSKAGNVSSHWAQSWFSTRMVGDFASIFCLIFSILVVKYALSASANFFCFSEGWQHLGLFLMK